MRYHEALVETTLQEFGNRLPQAGEVLVNRYALADAILEARLKGTTRALLVLSKGKSLPRPTSTTLDNLKGRIQRMKRLDVADKLRDKRRLATRSGIFSRDLSRIIAKDAQDTLRGRGVRAINN
jgi:hypothetical protein